MTARTILILALLASSGCVLGPHPHWTKRVPDTARTARNPYQGDAAAEKAGAKLYAEYCAACHGRDTHGIGRAPALRSPVGRDLPPGALFWLVTNGVIDRGMPPWAYLPEQQRWQLVTWLQR